MKHAAIGTIIHGTCRTEDLLEAFMEALDDILNDQITGGSDDPYSVAFVGHCHDVLGEIERDYDGTEELGIYAIEALEELLQEFAPPYCYFGAHEGDGSDFGFWPDIYALREINHVSDTVELDTMGGGEALHVNDHGNMTLYFRQPDGSWSEAWGIV